MADQTLARHFRSLGALFLGAFLLFIAQGMFLTMVPLRLAEGGAALGVISSAASAYFIGVLCGYWFSGGIIGSVGHIRAFAGFVAMIVTAALFNALIEAPPAITFARFVHGWAAAGTFLVIESWLHASTPNAWRGRVVSAYTFLSLGGLGLGQVLINVIGFNGADPVVIGGVFLALSILPIALGRVVSPVIASLKPLPIRALLERSPLGVVASLAAGLNMGAFWALGPGFGQSLGSEALDPGLVMAIVVFGGMVLIWPIGLISDNVGRRTTIIFLGAAGAVVCYRLIGIDGANGALLHMSLALYGGVIFSQYPLALSHATDTAPSTDNTVQLTRGLLLCNGLGMALGPIVGGAATARLGPEGLFVFTGVVTTSVLVYGLWLATRRPSIPVEEQPSFIAITETTPAALSIDPRVEDPQLDFDFDPRAPA